MNSICVVGGSGFIGTELIGEALSASEVVLNIDKGPSVSFPDQTIIADIRDRKQLPETLPDAFGQGRGWVVHLAAEHRDDVTPRSLYHDVNVTGTQNVLAWMDKRGLSRVIFTSSVAVYGLNKDNPDEHHLTDPFNDYGITKLQAEDVLREWYNKDPKNRTLIIIRPTVVFGPGNRGNVYNLLKQIASGKFMMIGRGGNKKSMAFVKNVTGFIRYCMEAELSGYRLYNYADKPDFSTKDLVKQAEVSLNRKITPIKIPYILGYTGGLFFDFVGRITGKKLAISAVRVKKFCATTQFSAEALTATGYSPPFSLEEGMDATIKSIIRNK